MTCWRLSSSRCLSSKCGQYVAPFEICALNRRYGGGCGRASRVLRMDPRCLPVISRGSPCRRREWRSPREEYRLWTIWVMTSRLKKGRMLSRATCASEARPTIPSGAEKPAMVINAVSGRPSEQKIRIPWAKMKLKISPPRRCSGGGRVHSRQGRSKKRGDLGRWENALDLHKISAKSGPPVKI